ncbi:transport-related protein [Trichosporon asahii var. asahii CBS 8904]|uniref:Conserved oligomeric Golgi complex subunit 8 n=1 Tax=Trichosporon asahii var. asahii (strain CBS 8904) TaxID=1220162 RepID=K1VJF2_TRIAC|nr:transport-related protein [Trichosporon asahii var. asahii CBS 8904]
MEEATGEFTGQQALHSVHRHANGPEPAPSLVDLLQSTAQDRHEPVPDFSSPAASGYLDQLLSLPLKSLLDEATVIFSEAAGVETELTNLCFREYPTFISVHKCSSAVTSAFDDFSSSLGKLLDAVPALEDECRTFVKSTKGVQDARSKALLVQEHQDKLFDLLEIPQLMDTCVRNGYYQEALELSGHATSLSKRYPGVELVQDVSKEVDAVLQVMVAQLLALLREPIKLPSLIKTVGYLRRLGSVEETELGLVFLVSRLSNFRAHQLLLEGDRGDPVRYVRKYVDLFREHVFDIISQFTTIFLESSSPSPAAASHLASFVGQCVDDLVQLVGEYVPKMTHDAASLSSILVQLGYCSLAFARVGLDFASLVTEPFNGAVSTAYAQALEEGASALSTTLKDAAKSVGSQTTLVIAGEYIPSLLAQADPVDWIKWGGSFEQLPSELSRLPPLAMLVNAHLSALNSLRLLAPLHLYPVLAGVQSASLLQCTHALAQYVRGVVALADAEKGQKAQLLRRTERELSPEERKQRRKETQWVCVALADSWIRIVCPLLANALEKGVYDGAMPAESSPELKEALDTLQAWIDDQIDNHLGGTPSPRKSREAERPPSPEKQAEKEALAPTAEVKKEEEPAPTEGDIAALDSTKPASPVKAPSPVQTPELVMETKDEPAAGEPTADAEPTPTELEAKMASVEAGEDTPKVDTPAVIAPAPAPTEEPTLNPDAAATKASDESESKLETTEAPADEPKPRDGAPAADEESTPVAQDAKTDADPIGAASTATETAAVGGTSSSGDRGPEASDAPADGAAAPATSATEKDDETSVPAAPAAPETSAAASGFADLANPSDLGQKGQDVGSAERAEPSADITAQKEDTQGAEETAEGKTSQRDIVPPPDASDSATPTAAAVNETPAEEAADEAADDDDAKDTDEPAPESTETAPQAAQAAPSTSGGGKKKKKNKKKK